jgi:hypothetical protein
MHTKLQPENLGGGGGAIFKNKERGTTLKMISKKLGATVGTKLKLLWIVNLQFPYKAENFTN